MKKLINFYLDLFLIIVLNFPLYLQSMNLINIIRSYGSKVLESINSFGIGCDKNGSYFVVMSWQVHGIAKYDRNWNYINFTSISSGNSILTLISNIRKYHLFRSPIL
jgi:hypothetical protein